MNTQEKLDHLHTLPFPHAAWWFIENVAADDPGRTDLFFYMRERFRKYQADPKAEQRYERQWAALPEPQ
jgi:hypothetical protein